MSRCVQQHVTDLWPVVFDKVEIVLEALIKQNICCKNVRNFPSSQVVASSEAIVRYKYLVAESQSYTIL